MAVRNRTDLKALWSSVAAMYSIADVGRMLGVALGYALAAKLVLALFAEYELVSIVWPPSGIALAALLLCGKKYWPAVYVGALLANLQGPNLFAAAALIALGNTLEGVLTRAMMPEDDLYLERPFTFVRLIFASSLGSLVAATGGAACLTVVGLVSPDALPSAWAHWWMGDVLGLVLVTPLILAWRSFPIHWLRSERILEAFAFVGATTLACAVIFAGFLEEHLGVLVRAFYLFAFSFWGAWRFGRHGALFVTSASVVASLIGVVHHVGYFGRHAAEHGLVGFWFFSMTLAVSSLGLALSVEQNERDRRSILSAGEFNRQLIESAQVGIVVQDLENRIKIWNPFMESLSEVRRAQTIGQTLAEVMPPSIASSQMEGFRCAAAGEQVVQEPFPWRLQSGRSGWSTAVRGPLRDESGAIVGVISMVSDVTRQVQSQAALRASEEQLRSIINNSTAIIYLKDRDGRHLLINRQFETLFHVTNESVRGKSDHEIFPKAAADRFRANDLQALESDTAIEFEETVPQDDGLHTYVSLKFRLLDSSGEPYGVCGISTDITLRTELQKRQISLLAEASPEATMLVAADGTIMLVNSVAATLFGYDPQEMIGLEVEALIPGSDRAAHAASRVEFMKNPSPRRIGARRLSAMRNDGTIFPAEVSLTPLYMERQTVIITVVLDITDRMAREREQHLSGLVYRAIGEAIMVVDVHNCIQAVNPAFTRLTGYTQEEAVGRSASLLRSGRHDTEFYRAMWTSIDRTGRWQGEIWNRRKNGEVYRQWLVISSVFGDDGAVTERVGMFSELTERKQLEQAIWTQANFDPLTGLPNRRMFQDRLAQEIKKAHRSGVRTAVMFLDLDRFKEVNDTMGHEVGDVLLQQAAKRLSMSVRDVDTVARLGGDEFAIILGAMDVPENADRVAQVILQKMAEPFRLGDELTHLSTSIGVTFYPDDAQDAEGLLKNADQAMYAAKNQGRNRSSFFTAALQDTAQSRKRLTADLRRAISEGQFEVHYQPIVELASGMVRKAEALIRWRHPTRGMVSPVEFIPAAEDTGLIVDIGNWVFQRAAAQAKDWRARYHEDFQISVNKSPAQFKLEQGSEQAWATQLAAMGLSGNSIVVEITEGLLLEATESSAAQLGAMRAAGMTIAIDDFGTGYSSLSYLKKFDIDYLKIDQSFVRTLSASSQDLPLCEAIIVMAHKLGLSVIAEGVETVEQRDLLLAAGCDLAQGYFFAKPMPASDMEAFLKPPALAHLGPGRAPTA
jgi:diguanylate cyclase (GGDEF)-like protein/PAS domain S-box-containing protein